MVTPDKPFLSHSPGDLLGDAMAVREACRVQTGHLAQPSQDGTALGRRAVPGGQEQTLRNQGALGEPRDPQSQATAAGLRGQGESRGLLPQLPR